MKCRNFNGIGIGEQFPRPSRAWAVAYLMPGFPTTSLLNESSVPRSLYYGIKYEGTVVGVVIMAYDGLDVLIKALENDGGLTNHLIGNTLFFQPDTVIRQAEEMLKEAQNGKLPVRFSKSENSYISSDGQLHSRLFANITEASRRSNQEDIFTPVRPGIRIKVDATGNRHVCKTIYSYTGEWVSAGRRISTIKNYMISHIWGNTADPYYFSALWNLALTPMHCSFILDKPDSHHEQIKDIKELYKAICWELYRPDKLMGIHFTDVPEGRYINQAKNYINNKLLNLIPKNQSL